MFNYPVGSSGKPPAKKKPPMASKPEPYSVQSPEQNDAAEPEDGAQMAEMHGPATEVHIQHEHEMGVHHVMSTHPDGHMHESDHESAEMAHEHGKKLAGVGGDRASDHDGPEGDAEEWK